MFICADTEDNSAELMSAGKSGFDKRVTQIAALARNGDSFYNKGNADEFLKWFKLRKEKFCYFHNLQYDLGNLFSTRLDELDMTLVGGRLIKAGWGNKIFVDSFNIWPAALWRIGQKFNLPKLGGKIEYDKTTGEDIFIADRLALAHDKQYVKRDVEIVMRAMQFAWHFAEREGIERLPATYGSLGVKLWQTWGGQNCSDSQELSRLALFGGRVELFKWVNDTAQICITDINSLYPFCMTKLFPAEMTIQQDLTDFGIADVTVKIPKSALTTLPVRQDDGRIIYPYGSFRGVWTQAEIRHAVECGATLCKVHSAIGTNEASRPYANYVNTLYQRRKISENEAEREFLKYLMNSFYGRLGMSGLTGKTVWQNERNKTSGVPFGKKTLVYYHMPLPKEVNWSHGAYVASYGRIELFRFLQQVGAERLIYCDTDSAVFDCEDGKIPFPVGKDLGQMKLVSWETDCEVFCPKVYRTGEKHKAKGVPKKHAKQFIEEGSTAFDLPFKLREAIRYYDRRNSRQLSVWRRVTKIRHDKYDRKTNRGNRFYPKKYSNL